MWELNKYTSKLSLLIICCKGWHKDKIRWDAVLMQLLSNEKKIMYLKCIKNEHLWNLRKNGHSFLERNIHTHDTQIQMHEYDTPDGAQQYDVRNSPSRFIELVVHSSIYSIWTSSVFTALVHNSRTLRRVLLTNRFNFFVFPLSNTFNIS